MADDGNTAVREETGPNRAGLLVISWLWVTVPFLYGVYQLVLTARKLFLG